jgi:hypothetical protein
MRIKAAGKSVTIERRKCQLFSATSIPEENFARYETQTKTAKAAPIPRYALVLAFLLFQGFRGAAGPV